MNDKQILEEILTRSPILMAVSFGMAFCLCLMLLPARGRQRIYASIVLSIIVPQIACIFPLYFYIFFLGDKYHTFGENLFRSPIAISMLVSPHWIVLIILSVVIWARHFGRQERSYLPDALAALIIGGTLPALATFTAITGVTIEIG